MYDLTKDDKWKKEAIKRTEVFESFKTINEHHDIGFMMFPAYGNGYLFGDKMEYKDVLLTSAKSLASRYNPKVGTIRSWSNKMHPLATAYYHNRQYVEFGAFVLGIQKWGRSKVL